MVGGLTTAQRDAMVKKVQKMDLDSITARQAFDSIDPKGLSFAQFSTAIYERARGPYACVSCGKNDFPTRATLGKHRKTCHPEGAKVVADISVGGPVADRAAIQRQLLKFFTESNTLIVRHTEAIAKAVEGS